MIQGRTHFMNACALPSLLQWGCSLDWCEHSTEHHDPLPTVKAKYSLKYHICLSLSTYLISFLQCLTDSDVNSRHPFFKILFLSLSSVTYVCPIFLALYSLELLIQHSVSLVRPQWTVSAFGPVLFQVTLLHSPVNYPCTWVFQKEKMCQLSSFPLSKN